MNIGHPITSITVRHGALADGGAQVPGPAAVVENVNIQCLYLAIFVNADLPPSQERVALTRDNHVLLTSEHAPDWPARLVGRKGDDGAELHRPRFFATKAATEPLHPH